MVEVEEYLKTVYIIIRTYGKIVYDQDTRDKNGYHRKMIIEYKDKDYFIRTSNRIVTGISII